MSHEITIRADGTAEAAYALLPAWHGLGTVVDHCMTSEEIRAAAHLDWTVSQHQVFARVGDDNILIHGQVANVRDDSKSVLGIVSDQYKVVNNSEAFDFVDKLHMDGVIRYESAGSLKGGRLVWLLARMPDAFQVTEQDRLEKYVLFTTAHDGSRAIRVMPTSVRVVCWNTLSLALGDESRGLTIHHVGNIEDKLAEARKAITTVGQKFDGFHRTAERLRDLQFDVERMRAFVNILVPKEDGVNDMFRNRMRESIIAAFTDGPQNLPGVRDTCWAAFNAVTQFADHAATFRGPAIEVRRENRMISSLMGNGARLKTSALNLLTTVMAA